MLRSTKASALIFLIAASIRLTLIFGFDEYGIGRPEPIRIAISLARNGSFADPYALPTGPTAHSAPVYPALIAPFYAIWGNTRDADFARFTLNTLAASVEYALLPQVAIALGFGPWPGILAGLGGALVPLQFWAECLGDFETTWIALFLEAVTLLFARWLHVPRLDWRYAAGWGAIWGIGLLLAPTVLPVLAGFCVIGAWKLRPDAWAASRWLATFAAATAIVLAPWLIRNFRQLGGVFLVRDDFGLELRVSNHHGASPVSDENFQTPFFRWDHPHISMMASREIQRYGEVAFERKQLRYALGWIRDNPQEFATLTLARAETFWFPRVPRFGWALAMTTLAAFASLTWLYRRSKLAFAVLGVILAGYSVVYYVVHNALRYQHPLWWIQILLMGWAAHTLAFRRLARHPVQDAEGQRGQLHEHARQG